MKGARTWIGLSIIFILALLSIAAPLITSYDPNEIRLEDHFQRPSASHLMGADQNGADVFSQVLFGGRVSLFVAVAVTTVCVTVGLMFGSLAGYRGGWTDLLMMRSLDMLQAFPGFLLALALVAVMGPSIRNLILAMCMTGWTGYARVVRAEIMNLKTKEYILGAVAAGATPLRIIVRHLWPNLAGILFVQATFGMAGVVLAESALSFLGLGASPDIPTWGALLNNGRRFITEAPHISLFPGLAILFLVLAINLLGESLRETFSPRA